MSKIEVDAITEQSGTTLTTGGGAGKTVVVDATTVTLGRCGGTVALASGATQTGFGRTGTVNWQTGSIKTATFTAASGEGYFCNTAGGTFEVDLPAGSAGAIVSVQDYNNTFDTNALTVDPNGSEKINGGTAGDAVTLSTEGQGVTFVYIDATVGWRSVQDNTFSQAGVPPNPFVVATGGTVKTSGDFKTHIFTSPGTFEVTNAGNPCGSNTVDYFVVAGGGGTSGDRSGGGGAGGFRVSNSAGCVPAPTMSPLIAPASLPVSVQPYSVTIGGGGAAASPPGTGGSQGSNSIFSTITSTGGGEASPGAGGDGGSGGGGYGGASGGPGNNPSVSPAQGTDGGPGAGAPNYGAGGGGGASAVGGTGGPTAAAAGGAGSFVADAFIGGCAPSYGTPGPVSSTRYFAGGGSGGGFGIAGNSTSPAGGGGRGAPSSPGTGVAGTVNTGGGAGGGSNSPGGCGAGALGGSGVVMIRYKFQ